MIRRADKPRSRWMGRIGLVAADRLSPSGYVKVHGELWQAELAKGHKPVDVGNGVRVIETKGIKLVVEPVVKRDYD
jgi:membrane protein implicated in regulation of membrane protease activity